MSQPPSTPNGLIEPVELATPSQQSEAGETTFDPESPMPLCRAPKPEMMKGFSPLAKRDMDHDVLPLGRQSSLSPVAHVSNIAKFNLGSFDLAKDSLGSSTLRIRQAISPEQRNLFASQHKFPATPLRTPSKQQLEAPRSAFVQRSIALPPVTKTIERKLTKRTTPRTDRKREVASDRRIRKQLPAITGGTSATVAVPAEPETLLTDTPTRSRRKSLRSAVASAVSSDAVVIPSVNATCETQHNSPSSESSMIIVQATPVKPIPIQPVASSSSTTAKVTQITDSKLRQPTKSRLKKPSTSFLPVLKSVVVPLRTSTITCSAPTVPAFSSVPPSTSFDFAPPRPNQKITNFTPAARSRSALPAAQRSPIKQPDVFSSLGPPIRPTHRGPILSTSRGPPVRPNMTPVRGGIRAFGSPVRSNMSPMKVSRFSDLPVRLYTDFTCLDAIGRTRCSARHNALITICH